MDITFKFNDNTSLTYPNFTKLNIIKDAKETYFLVESIRKEQTQLPTSKIKYVKINENPFNFLFHKEEEKQ